MGLAAPPEAPVRRSRVAMRLRAPARPRPPRTPLPTLGLVAVWAFASLSALSLWFLLYAFTLSGLQEASSQHSLYAALRSELAQGIAPLGGSVPLGKPVALLRVPQAGINDVVVEGTTSALLEQGPGLLAGTPLPGQPGVSVIFGRQAMFGGPFRHLAGLRQGDVFQVITGQGTFTYRVDDLRYPGDPLPSPLPAGQSRMIMVTIAGSSWLGGRTPERLLYVDTSLVGKVVAAPSGPPVLVSASQLPMHVDADSDVLIQLVLRLQLLLLAGLGVAWAGSRWSTWQTWLVGAPAILAATWGVSQVAVALLPNLL
jgi:sortase A